MKEFIYSYEVGEDGIENLVLKEQIVRCKDCKYVDTERPTSKWKYCMYYERHILDNDFCSRGTDVEA